VLEVVQDQQQDAVAQDPRQGLIERLAGHVPHPKRPPDGRHHLVGGG
jgi:hypothetical protein